MRQSLLFLSFLMVMIVTNGQENDTLNKKIPETWKKFHFAPRAGIGIQKSFFAEAGLSLQKYVFEATHGFMVFNIYSAFEWAPSGSKDKAVYGPKLGYEIVTNGVAGAIEVKYLSNGDNDDVMITPKIGIGFGIVNLFYGYNFSTNKYPFERIRKNQFSLVFNSNLLFYGSKYEKK
jgi:hypothetical protein